MHVGECECVQVCTMVCMRVRGGVGACACGCAHVCVCNARACVRCPVKARLPLTLCTCMSVQCTRLCPAPCEGPLVSDIWSRQHLPGTLGLTRSSPSAACGCRGAAGPCGPLGTELGSPEGTQLGGAAPGRGAGNTPGVRPSWGVRGPARRLPSGIQAQKWLPWPGTVPGTRRGLAGTGSPAWGLGDHLLGLGTAPSGRHTHRAGRAPAMMQRFPVLQG